MPQHDKVKRDVLGTPLRKGSIVFTNRKKTGRKSGSLFVVVEILPTMLRLKPLFTVLGIETEIFTEYESFLRYPSDVVAVNFLTFARYSPRYALWCRQFLNAAERSDLKNGLLAYLEENQIDETKATEDTAQWLMSASIPDIDEFFGNSQMFLKFPELR